VSAQREMGVLRKIKSVKDIEEGWNSRTRWEINVIIEITSDYEFRGVSGKVF
jgi:hypothetical protein